MGAYAITDGLVRVVVKRVLEAGRTAPPPLPVTMVPAFSMEVEPAIDLGVVPDEVGGAARELARHLRFVGEDEGE